MPEIACGIIFDIIQRGITREIRTIRTSFNSAKNAKNKEKRRNLTFPAFLTGVPGGIRTRDLLVRSQTLYPAELRAHTFHFRMLNYYSMFAALSQIKYRLNLWAINRQITSSARRAHPRGIFAAKSPGGGETHW